MQNYLLRKSLSAEQKVANVVVGFGVSYLWVVLLSLLFKSLGVYSSVGAPANLAVMFLMSVVIAPIWEEAVFRVSLVGLTEHLPSQFLMPIMIASSCLFGWLHGGVMNVFFQGIVGFVIACVYVKNGYCYKSAVAVHALYNLIWFVNYFK